MIRYLMNTHNTLDKMHTLVYLSSSHFGSVVLSFCPKLWTVEAMLFNFSHCKFVRAKLESVVIVTMQGMTVVDLSATNFAQTLESLHCYLLQVLFIAVFKL